MIINGSLKVYVARDKVDLRKSYDGLSVLVQDVLLLDPLSGYLFVFFNRRLDKVKALYWDRNGFCLWQKRMEKGRFRLWSFKESYWLMSLQEFQMMLYGVEVRLLPVKPNFSGYVVG